MQQQYSPEKAMEEAQRIKTIVGKGGTSEDFKTAEQIITEEKRKMLSKLREELLLISDSILVIDMGNSSTELADILVDVVPPTDADAVREYLNSEKNIAIIREKQDPQHRIKFYIKIR
jgi:Mg/Co/Ni transporter MgtE